MLLPLPRWDLQERVVDGVIADFRFAARQLARRPGSTLVAVLTLALGTGAATAMFSLVDRVLLRPLPFSEPDQLVALCETNPSLEGFCVASPPDAMDWSRQSRTFASIGFGRTWPFTMRGESGAQGVRGGLATPALFQTLRLSPLMGRLLYAQDLTATGRHVALLSHVFWTSRFGGDRSVLGHSIELDGERYQIVGVLKPDDAVPLLSSVEVWVPLPFDPQDEENRRWRGFVTIGRLAPGVPPRGAQQELNTIQAGLAERHPATNRGWGVRVEPLLDRVVGPVRPTLLVFLGAVGILLIVAVVNVTNLLVARTLAREKELAIRSAVGASRPVLYRLLAIEGFLLAALGGIMGIVVAAWATDGLVHLIPNGLPRVSHVALDARLLGFSLGLTLLVGMIAPLVPAWRATRLDLATVLKQGSRPTGWRAALGLRGGLVVAEVSTAFVLAIGAGLLTRNLAAYLRWDPGFERSQLLTFWTLASTGRYPTAPSVAALFDRLEGELRALPGVTGVGMTSSGPIFGGEETGEFSSDDGGEPLQPVAARWYDMSPGYFPALGVALRRGRFFTAADRAGAPPVALINESMAHRLFGTGNPIGRRIRERNGDQAMDVVGVVADVPPFTPGVAARPEIYWPYQQSPRWASYFVLRTSVDPATLARAVESRLTTVDPDLRAVRMETMPQLISDEVARPRFQLILIGLFAVAALTLALVGVYGVLAASVTSRTREIGVRLALGAGSRRVLAFVLRQGMALVAVGMAVGAIVAVWVSRFAAALLHGVAPTDPLTYGAIAVLVGGAAAVACIVPARRAARVNPVISLRAE
jgi:putative ABC transport system permease protein